MYHICLSRPDSGLEYIASKLNPYAADKEFRQLLLRADLQNTATKAILMLDDTELKSQQFKPENNPLQSGQVWAATA